MRCCFILLALGMLPVPALCATASPEAVPTAAAAQTLLAPRGSASSGTPVRDIRRDARQILSSPEFRHLQRLQELGEMQTGGGEELSPEPEDIAEDDDESSEITVPGAGLLGGFFGPVLHGLAWVCLGVICGLIVYLVVKALQNRERPLETGGEALQETIAGDAEPEHAPGDFAADEYLRQARDLAGQGRYREAVARLLLGAMSHVERRGLIRFRRGLTCRDYVRAVRGRDAEYAAMRSLVRVYEPIGFGRREATWQHFETSLSDYEAGFGETGTLDD